MNNRNEFEDIQSEFFELLLENQSVNKEVLRAIDGMLAGRVEADRAHSLIEHFDRQRIRTNRAFLKRFKSNKVPLPVPAPGSGPIANRFNRGRMSSLGSVDKSWSIENKMALTTSEDSAESADDSVIELGIGRGDLSEA